jgi:hypothetical protein
MVPGAASLGHSQMALCPLDGGDVYAGARTAPQLRYALGRRGAQHRLHRAHIQEAEPMHVLGLSFGAIGIRYVLLLLYNIVLY